MTNLVDTRKIIFISGAALGIGRATALRFAAGGWRVGLYDIDEAGVSALRDSLGAERAVAGRLDVTDAAAFAGAVAAFCAASGGRLDLMFNNAGIAASGAFGGIPVAKAHAIVDVNLKGVINGAYAALPHLRTTPGARLLSMSSASAIYGAPGLAVYSSTKFAVKGLTEALDLEWRPLGIRVMDILPLFVKTPMVDQIGGQLDSLKRLGVHLTAADIADLVWTAAHRPGWRCPLHWYPGWRTRAVALGAKLSPGWMNRLTNRWIQG